MGAPPPALVILAAGVGSRFGGPKQLSPIGPYGETLLDYAIYDALRAGFSRAVLVIRKELAASLKKHVSAVTGGAVPVDYVEQRVPEGRAKPWGTAHAVLAVRGALEGPFAVCNADDFYGPGAYRLLAEHLTGRTVPPEHALVGYRLDATLSEHGGVARAVASCGPDGLLARLVEGRDVRRENGGRLRGVTAAGEQRELTGAEHTSMNLSGFTPDVLAVLVLYGLVCVAIGLAVVRRAGQGRAEFFLSGRRLPWWLLGVSLVATTFSTDTPNLITDLVRSGGVSQNWVWWAFAVTGMCTVFFYAKLWRRSAALTDIAFYEIRYSGKPAAFLRGFRAIYLGVFFNVMIMASVNLSATKIAGVMLGWDRGTAVLIGGAVTVLYAASSGLSGVVLTDFVQFLIAMVGAVLAAVVALRLPQVGGLSGLFAHPAVTGRLSLLPDFSDWRTATAVLIVPLAVQWWSTWYPGSEPGGRGYVAQRMLAAPTERDAMRTTLLFNVLHYAVRPWPWIIVALASLIVYPDLASIAARFPHIDRAIVRNDLAYSAMLVYLPHGLLGLMIASLAAAYMSTISTHLNWGASYAVEDCYRRFVAPDKDERHYVRVGRAVTIGLIALASALSLWLQNSYQAFQILLQIGAGTGLIFLLRWFWWRINAWSEIAGMVISFVIAVYFQFVHRALGLLPLAPTLQLVIGIAITTVGWLAVTFATPPTDRATLQTFYDRIRPMGPGWTGAVTTRPANPGESVTAAFLCWFLGCAVIYAALFCTGYVLYGKLLPGIVCLVVAGAAAWGLFRALPRVGFA